MAKLSPNKDERFSRDPYHITTIATTSARRTRSLTA